MTELGLFFAILGVNLGGFFAVDWALSLILHGYE